MIVKLLTEHHLEILSFKGGCGGSFVSTLVKMSNCWKSHAASHFSFTLLVPYACTGGGGAVTGLTSCMNVPSTISTTYLETLTAGAALLGNIDSTSNMRNDKIWIFDGTADTKVNPGKY